MTGETRATGHLFGKVMGGDGGPDHDVRTDPYASLDRVLRAAFDQAASGKGRERHATGQNFEDQPMQQINQLVGVGFSTGQAIKKIQEARRMAPDPAIRELLGAIVYTAGAIIHLEKDAAEQRRRTFEELRQDNEVMERR